MIFDPNYCLFVFIPGLILGLWAQMRLQSAYGKYSRISLESGMTGAQAARQILDQAGLHEVPVAEVPGHLSDHYDPTKRALFLSPENYQGRTVAAVGVAAHEAGHALQHQAAYGLFNVRMALVPAVQIASYAWTGILMLGLFLGIFSKMLLIATLIFAVMLLFQLVTLPVEYDASRRAKEQLFRLGLVHEGERQGVSRVLDAAALTYVAAMVATLLQFLYYLSRARR